MQIQLGNVSDIIHLAITPAFLLVGTGMQLRVLANRLARIIDRVRVLEADTGQDDTSGKPHDDIELGMLYRRMHAIHRAISLTTGCALLVCTVIVMLFVDSALQAGLGRLIGGLFTLSMLSLIGSFGCFLHEIFIASEWLSLTMRRSLASGMPPADRRD